MRTLFRRVSPCIGFLVCLFLTASGRADLWTKADRQGSVVYFVHASPPRLERFDLASETDLPPIPVPDTPTAIATDSNAVFVACGLTVYRMELNGSEFTALINHTNTIDELVVVGSSLLFRSGAVVTTLDKSSGVLQGQRTYLGLPQGLVYSALLRKVFGTWIGYGWPEAPQQVWSFSVAINGSLPESAISNGIGIGSDRLAVIRLTPDNGRLLTAPGSILNTEDLSEAGRMEGNIGDIAFNGDVIAVLRGTNVSAYTSALQKTGTQKIPFEAFRIFTTPEAVFAFGQPIAGQTAVAKISWSDLSAPSPGTAVDPRTISFVPDAVVGDDSGILYLLSGRFRSIFRWDSVPRSYLDTISLVDTPTNLVAAPSLKRLYALYRTGKITAFDLTNPSPSETIFNQTLPTTEMALMAGNDLVVSTSPFASVRKTIAIDPAGMRRGETATTLYRPIVWDPIGRHLFLRDSSALLELSYENGVFGLFKYQYVPGVDFHGAVAVSPTGSQLLSSGGEVIDVQAFTNLAALNIDVTDAIWNATGLNTLRSIGGYCQVQHWADDFQLLAGSQIEGRALKLLQTGTNYVVVTALRGQTQFHVFGAGLEPLFSSSLLPGPTDILLSATSIPRFVDSGAVLGRFTAVDDATNSSHTFSLISSSQNFFYVDGDQLRTSSEINASPSDEYFITVRAESAAGGSVDRAFRIVVANQGLPFVSISVLKPELFEGDAYYDAASVVLNREGDSNLFLSVTLQVGGTAIPNVDYGIDQYRSSYSNQWTISFSAGSNSAVVPLRIYTDNEREPGETLSFSVVANGPYDFDPGNIVSVQIWDSRFEQWLARRNGRVVSVEEADPGADPDGNSVPNFVEYHSGVSATTNGLYHRPTASLEVDGMNGRKLSVLFQRDASLADAERDFMVSTDLVTWTQANPEEEVLTTQANVETVRWSVPSETTGNLFGQLRIAPIGQLRSPDFDVPGLGLHMIGLPNRPSSMGSPGWETGRFADEGPEFKVRFSCRLWMARTETTQSQYTALMTNNPSWSAGDDLPVDGVTWEQAVEFCHRLTARESATGHLPRGYAYRLPTEAEWESSARSTNSISNGYAFPSTDGSSTQFAWFAANSSFHSHAVGGKQSNAWGLVDMAGNVAEWCVDWYGAYPYQEAVDPAGAFSGLYRVVRGGSFIDGQTSLRVAARNGALPSQGSRFIGFRVVLGVARE
jgi:formylglycine-generating enzyme required for sulfatase activity